MASGASTGGLVAAVRRRLADALGIADLPLGDAGGAGDLLKSYYWEAA